MLSIEEHGGVTKVMRKVQMSSHSQWNVL